MGLTAAPADTVPGAVGRSIRALTPNWFTVCMGTGIVSLTLAAFPYNFAGRLLFAHALWAVTAVLFALLSVAFVLRAVLFPETVGRLLRHPVQSMFLGAIPMGLAPVINGLSVFYGNRYAAVALNLWILDVVLSLLSGWVVPYYMFIHQDHSLDRMTGVWLLPIVASEVAAASAGALAPHLVPVLAKPVVLIGYLLWALSVPLAMGVLAVLFLRLVTHKLPPREMAISTWLALGPIGTGALGMLALGAAAPVALGPALADWAAVANQAGLLLALLLWGYGLWWLLAAMMMTVHYVRHGLPFNMGWWGLTFPLGVYTGSTLVLGQRLQFAPLGITGAALALLLFTLWAVVLIRTVRGLSQGQLLVAPCLAALAVQA